MRVEFKDGLLFTSIEVTYNGKTKLIDNIVIDTGGSKSLLSQDSVDDIGISVSGEDEIVISYGIGGKEYAFVKVVDNVKIGEFSLSNCNLDFTVFQYEDINGLLGLDLLLKAGFIIDLKRLDMYLQE